MRITVKLSDYLWRPLTDSDDDTNFVLHMRNALVAQSAFYTQTITREDHKRFLRLAEERDEINWIIEKGGERVGASGVFRIDYHNRRAEGGRVVMVYPELYVLNVIVMHYVIFEHLGMNKSIGETLMSNAVVNRALARVGVKKEGVLREHIILDGVPQDACLYGTLVGEWELVKPGIWAKYGTPQIIKHAGDDE